MTMPGGRAAGAVYLTVLPDARQLGPRLVAQAKQAATTAERRAGKVKVEPDTRRFGGLLNQGLRRPLKEAGQQGQAAFHWLAAGTVAVGINQAVQSASNLNETVNKSRVVFGPASRMVEDFGRNAATSLGLSTQEAIENAATLGNLFVSMKLGRGEAAQMSTTMVRLAGDMASFNNASPQEVLEAIRAGLVGETEPLRRFGVNLNDAALRAEAMRLGLGKIGPTLTASQRAQAAYSLILQQTKTAQGDFARTSDGLANRQRILAAQYKDSQAALGTALLPTMNTAVGIASKLATGFANLDRATGGVSTRLLLGAVAVGGIAYAGAKMVRTLGEARGAWVAYQATKAAQVGTDAALATAETGLAGATGTSAAAASGARVAWAGLASTLGLAAGALLLAANAKKIDQGADTLGARIHAQYVAPIYAKLGIYSKARVAQLQAETGGTKAASAAAKGAAGPSEVYAQALKEVGAGATGASPRLTELSGKLRDQRKAFAETKRATAEQVQSYKGLISQSKVTAAEVVKDLRNQTANFKTYSRDVRRLIKAGVSPVAIRELSQKGPEYVHALATGSNRELQVYKRYWRDRQREVRGDFADSMERQYQTLVRKMRAMQREINRLKGKTVPVTATASVEINPDTRRGLLALGIKGYGTRFFAKGGRITEGTTPTADDVLIRASKHEAVVPAHLATRADFKAWAQANRIPGYAAGGIIGGFLNPATAAVTRYGDLAAQRLGDVAGRRLAAVVAKAVQRMLAPPASFGGTGARISGPIAAIVRGVASRYGWGSGAQWAALSWVISHESGFNPNAQNPTSTAYGLFQFLDGTWAGVGGHKTSDPYLQSVYGLRYIRSRYGTPLGAQSFWRAHGWYDQGAWKLLADQVAMVHRGEMIVPAQPAEEIRQASRRGGMGVNSMDALASRIAAAIAANPPRIYLDRQEVTRIIGTGMLWESRR